MTNNYFKVWHKKGSGRILSELFFFDSNKLSQVEDAFDSARESMNRCKGQSGHISVCRTIPYYSGPWTKVCLVGENQQEAS
jgi:hypothetical protein